MNRKGEDAGSQAGNRPWQVGFLSGTPPPLCSSTRQSEEGDNAEGMGGGDGEGDSDGWLFCGCLAGDLLEEWIQK